MQYKLLRVMRIMFDIPKLAIDYFLGMARVFKYMKFRLHPVLICIKRFSLHPPHITNGDNKEMFKAYPLDASSRVYSSLRAST